MNRVKPPGQDLFLKSISYVRELMTFFINPGFVNWVCHCEAVG